MTTTFATTNASSSILPPISSMLPSATFSPPRSSSAPLSRLPEDAVATSSHYQKFSAVRKLTHDLQQQKLRYFKRPQLPPHEAGTPMKRIVHTTVYKQKLTQYNNALKQNEHFINQLLCEQATELNKIIDNVDATVNKLQSPPQLTKFKSSTCKSSQMTPLRIHITPNNCHNCCQCYHIRCSHLPHNYCHNSSFLLTPSSPALNPIQIQSPIPQNFYIT